MNATARALREMKSTRRDEIVTLKEQHGERWSIGAERMEYAADGEQVQGGWEPLRA